MEGLIIASVFKREPLWNPSHTFYKNVGVLKTLWQEVAEEVNTNVKNAKMKWKNMRAYFFKELRKRQQQNYCDGDDSAVRSQWLFYEPLQFLRSTISERDSNSPTADQSLEFQNEQPIPSTSYNIQDNFKSDGCSTSPAASSSSSHTSRNKKRNDTHSLNEENNHIIEKKRKIGVLEEDAEPNSDMFFFKSLIPYMVDIPMLRKLQLRSKIQDLILNELHVVEDKTDVQNITDDKSTHDNSL